MGAWQAAAEILGAVIGAGFASGREIDSFFTRFGLWSWLGIAAAVTVVGCISLSVLAHPEEGGMPRRWRGAPMQYVWQGMFGLLMAFTGGAMLAGAGEIAALLLPFHRAKAVGLGLTLLAAWLVAGGEGRMLACVSQGLILCLTAVMLLGLVQPAQEEVLIVRDAPWWTGLSAAAHGLSYGGFNAALAAPVMALISRRLPAGLHRRCAIAICAVLAALLCCANGVLLRHTALQGESLPFVRLLAPLGKYGYVLCCCALYLAVLTTLTSALRGLNAMLPGKNLWVLLAVAAIALCGFEQIVGVVYPILGAGCMLLLLMRRPAAGK